MNKKNTKILKTIAAGDKAQIQTSKVISAFESAGAQRDGAKLTFNNVSICMGTNSGEVNVRALRPVVKGFAQTLLAAQS